MNDLEFYFMIKSLASVKKNVAMAKNWYMEQYYKNLKLGEEISQKQFLFPRHYRHVDDCLNHLT